MRFPARTCTLGLVLLALSCGGGGGGEDPPEAPAAGVTVSVSPATATVAAGGNVQLTASVDNATDPGVAWTVTGGVGRGSVNAAGLYTAPGAPPAGAVTVRATSVEDPAAYDEASLTVLAPPDTEALHVDLQVGTAGGWSGAALPVTSGVPLPSGAVTDAKDLRVTTAGGTAVPAQFRVLSRWEDGSIRWVLVDFAADVAAAGTGYALTDGGTGAPPASDLHVTESAGSIEVSTGALALTVSKTAFRLFESVRIDRDGDGQVDDECLDPQALAGVVVTDGGTAYRMDQLAPDSIAIEESGPVRVCIRVEGRHRSAPGAADKLRFIARIHAWSGQPFVRVVYTFKNMEHDGEATAGSGEEAAQVRSFVGADAVSLDLPLDLPAAPGVLFGGDPTDHAGSLGAGQSASLVQGYSGAYDAGDPLGDGAALTNAWATGYASDIDYTVAGAVTGAGGHAPGFFQVWAGSGGDRLRVTACVRDFWQLYPKALTAHGDGRVQVELWPAAAWRLQVFEGAMKTHELLLAFERADAGDAARGRALARLCNDAPFAACAPEHYAATRVFGDIATTNAALDDVSGFRAEHRTRVATYLAELRRQYADILADRDGNAFGAGHEYGMWNYGDGKATDGAGAWENQHWSVSRACFVWFAASGNRDLLAFGDTALRHFRDVDVLHSDVGRRFAYSEPGNASVTPNGTSQLGQTRMNPNDKQHHLGNYNNGSPNFEAFKGEMLGDHYLLTGDGLSLEVLREAYVYLRGTWKRHYHDAYGGVDHTFSAEARRLSNPMFVAVSYYECTGDPEAKALAEYVLGRARARQQAQNSRDPQGIGFSRSNGYHQPWMIGHLLEAMDWYRWILEDGSIDANLSDGMTWLIGPDAEVYDGSGGFGSNPPNRTNYSSINYMIGAGYAAAHRASGGTTWRDRAAQFLDTQNAHSTAQTAGFNHKTFAQRFRAGPALLRVFED